MKTKFLLAALALPCIFAACSQDELADGKNVNTTIPSNAIQGLTLNVTKGIEGTGNANTRAEWIDGSNKIQFEKGDKISMYWLGENDGSDFNAAAARNSLTGKFNSIFRTEDGSSFTSEALVFEGGNVAVFPGDVSFYNEGKVVLNVSDEQDAKTIENVPYISNQLYIKKYDDAQADQLPGYYGDKQLDCPVKMAANVFNLTLNLSNIPAGYDFTVQSVELVTTSKSDGHAFATESNVTTIATAPTTTGEIEYTPNGGSKQKKNTIVAQTWSAVKTATDKLTTTALAGTGTTITARFVILPTDAAFNTNFEGAQIVINTNCGTITLDGSAVDAESNAKYPVLDSDNNKATIGETIEAIVAAQKSTTKDGKFENEKIGKTFSRSIAVDVKEAKLDGSKVYSSEDIIRYANLYKAMSKTDKMGLVLASKAKDGIFPNLTKAAVDAFHALDKTGGPAMTLTPSADATYGVTSIEITGGGAVFDIPELAGDAILMLDASTWNMDDAMTLDDNITAINNKGTLTINGTVNKTTKKQNALTTDLINEGTLKIGGNNLLILNGFSSSAESIVDIEAGQELQLADNIAAGAIYGTINVKTTTSYLTIAKDKSVVNNGTINNYGTVASTEGNAGLTNAIKDLTGGKYSAGTINVMDANATTYVKDNSDGIIILKSRTDEVKVDATKEGKIVYNYNVSKDGSTFKKVKADKFTYVKFDNAGVITLFDDSAEQKPTSVSLGTTSFEIASGTCTLTSDDKTIADLFVAKNAVLKVNAGNSVNVENLTNDGTITIGGTITHSGEFNDNGRVLSNGGAITKKATT